VLAAHLLGPDEVPCIVLAHLTPTQRRATWDREGDLLVFPGHHGGVFALYKKEGPQFHWFD
jgi:hypothetical protein